MYDDLTQLSTTRESPVVLTGPRETDWYIAEDTVPGDADGRAECNDPNAGTYKCDQFHINIEPENFSVGIICHEVGHGVGFVHGEWAAPRLDNDAPALGCSNKPNGRTDSLNPNQVRRINNNY